MTFSVINVFLAAVFYSN